MDIIVPATILVLLGSPVSPPCDEPVVGWRVVQEDALLGFTQPQEVGHAPLPLLVTQAVSITYSVDGKTLTVRQEKPGRIFCSGFGYDQQGGAE